MIPRDITAEAKLLLKQFRALCLTGPRQSGKTTLSRMLLKDKPYVNFEDPVVQQAFEEKPEDFMRRYKNGAVFDEAQRVPELFRYLQVLLDQQSARGQFIITGSNNFLLQENISQSLAGRAGYLSLLPLSYSELVNVNKNQQLNEIILTGGYPEIWEEKLSPPKWINSYVQTYVQRDVRQLRNISNLGTFNRFIRLCANYAGQIVNREELAKQLSVDTKTIQAWLGLLENSYLLFLLQPWHKNLNKRIIKSPKLYFYDSGLLCTLLNIKSKTGLSAHPSYGSIFENWCVSEILKNRMNLGESNPLYYFRDSAGNEIDLVLEKENETLAIEVKATKKINSDHLKGLRYWEKYTNGQPGIILYQGKDISTIEKNSHILSWSEIKDIN